MPTTTTPSGTSIAYEVVGSGPSIVLLHGITESRRTWDPLVAPLATERTVVLVDLPGHGESGRAASGDLATMAAEVARVVDDLDVGLPLVVGHSLGGIVATAYASGHPTRGVVNVDQPLALAGFRDALVTIEPALRGDTATFTATIGAVLASMEGQLDGEELARVRGLRRPDQEVVLGIWAPVLESEPEELEALVRSITAGVGVPYLALHGIDPGPDYEAWLREVLPSAEVEVWPDLGHYPHLVEPDRFLERLATFERTFT